MSVANENKLSIHLIEALQTGLKKYFFSNCCIGDRTRINAMASIEKNKNTFFLFERPQFGKIFFSLCLIIMLNRYILRVQITTTEIAPTKSESARQSNLKSTHKVTFQICLIRIQYMILCGRWTPTYQLCHITISEVC